MLWTTRRGRLRPSAALLLMVEKEGEARMWKHHERRRYAVLRSLFGLGWDG